MNRVWDRLVFKLKALLCVALVMNLGLWTFGCGQTAMEMPDGSIRLALTPGHPLAVHLQGSAFEGATALEIRPGGQEFRFIFPDDARSISGQFTEVNGRYEVSSLTMVRGTESATLELDPASKCITRMSTSGGYLWERPAEWGTPAVAGDGVDAYLDANRELLALAEDVDGRPGDYSDGEMGGSSPVSPEKAGQAAFGPAAALLLALGMAVLHPAGIAAAVIWVIQLINLIF